MVDRILALPEGTRLYLLAPVVRGRKGEYRKELAEYLKKGYQRVKVDGKFYEIAEVPALDKKFTHDIDVVVDRIVVRADIGTRLADSLEQALKLADGLAIAEMADGGAVEGAKANKQRNETAERLIFSEKFACPVSGFTIPEVEPRLFSFNNPFGACPKCGGLGVEQHIDPELVIPDKDRTLQERRDPPWAKSSSPYYTQTLQALGKFYKFTLDTKWKDLPKSAQNAILHGSGEDEIRFAYDDGMRSYETKKPFEGVVTNLERRWQRNRERLGARGDREIFHRRAVRRLQRLSAQARGAVRQDRRPAHRRSLRHVDQARRRMVRRRCRRSSTSSRTRSRSRILKEIRDRLRFLVDVGLEYLTLARASGTLSGGESQRIRLASQIGSGLTGVLYVLDEPSIGLHQRDNARLLETLQAAARPRQHRDRGGARRGRDPHRRLRARHRPRRRHPRRPDHRAGHARRHHEPPGLAHRQIPHRRDGHRRSPERRPLNPRRTLKVINARGNNLKNVTAEIPLGLFTCRHRRLGRRQVHAAGRHALQGGGAPPQRRQRRPRPARPASKGSSTSTR